MSPFEKKRADVNKMDVSSTETISPDTGASMTKPLKLAVWELKVRMLERALERAKFNQKKAAQILGLTYHQFRGLYRQYRSNDG
jgi:psp operon transcriptional activator